MALHYDGEVQIKKLELGPFGTNCYIVICPQTAEGVIIDTPGEPRRILSEAEGIDVKYILITHTHLDHLGAFSEVRSATKAPVGIHSLEAARLPSPPDFFLEEGEAISFGKVSLKTIHTPGHTPGSICLLTGRHLFSGDTLFPGGPGKTRTPADFRTIVKSISEKLFILPDDTLVYPGHDLDTILEKERREFLAFSQQQHAIDLCGDVLWLSS